MCNVKNAPWHTLIVDESTDISTDSKLELDMQVYMSQFLQSKSLT